MKRWIVGVLGLVGWLASCEVSQSTCWAQPAEKLPWTKPNAPGKPAARRAQSARELLVNVEESQLANFRDGQPLTVDEDETLFRILYRVPMFGAFDTERLSVELDAAAVDAAPAESRAKLFHLQGRVLGVDRVEILPEVSRRLGFEYYWRVRMQLADSGRLAILCSRWVPAPWRTAPTLDERAGAYAMFLKTGEKEGDHAPLYFVSDRIQWFPERVEPDQIAADHVLLADLGFDFSRLADLDGRDAKPLGGADQECFYQMLRAAGRATPAQLATAAPFELAPFLTKPAERHGQLFRLAGRVKRITPIEVDEIELQERFGIDRYYQLDLVVGLGNQEVRLAKGPNDTDAPVLSGGFPLVVCVRELPKSLAEFANRKEINEDVELEGFYFRLWSFQSGMLNKFAVDKGTNAAGQVDPKKVDEARRRQPSPLFIAPTARVVVRSDGQSTWLGKLVGGLIVFVIAALFVAKWYAGFADRRAREQLRKTMRLGE